NIHIGNQRGFYGNQVDKTHVFLRKRIYSLYDSIRVFPLRGDSLGFGQHTVLTKIIDYGIDPKADSS
ncbi:MAG: hypothetical protein DRP60_05520, partial [Spirochaetes bacterium]